MWRCSRFIICWLYFCRQRVSWLFCELHADQSLVILTFSGFHFVLCTSWATSTLASKLFCVSLVHASLFLYCRSCDFQALSYWDGVTLLSYFVFRYECFISLFLICSGLDKGYIIHCTFAAYPTLSLFCFRIAITCKEFPVLCQFSCWGLSVLPYGSVLFKPTLGGYIVPCIFDTIDGMLPYL